MASGIFAILDDIAALMDDVAMASKVATQKTAGILGDDLAVNAEKATGFVSSRELPVLWAITKGSLLNKAIIIPVIMALNYFLPPVITIILIIGGLYLSYEGMEKVVEFIFHKKHENQEEIIDEVVVGDAMVAEKKKVKSAITTDFILSIEIVIIALSTVLGQPFWIQFMTVCIVAIVATFGVYGIVALIVRMDDAGFSLIRKSSGKGFVSKVGHLLVNALPMVIKILGVVGTIALLLVSGGIFVHYVEPLHHVVENWPMILRELTFGIVAGTLMVLVMSLFHKLRKA